MNIIILCGISGSGKSTWATEFVKTHSDYICVNRDALRLSLVKSLDGYYQRPDLYKLEEIINSISSLIINEADYYGYNVLVDNTNLTERYIKQYIEYTVRPIPSKDWNVTWQYKLFDCHATIAKTRVMLRDHCAMGPEHLLPMEHVAYIDKQSQQYTQIKDYLNKNYAEHEFK